MLLSNVAQALVWAHHTLMDSSLTWRMNSVPNVWCPEHSMWACCMEGVHKAAAHSSKTADFHSSLRTNTARLPTLCSSHSASCRRAGPKFLGPGLLAVLHGGGTWWLALCCNGRTGGPGQP